MFTVVAFGKERFNFLSLLFPEVSMNVDYLCKSKQNTLMARSANIQGRNCAGAGHRDEWKGAGSSGSQSGEHRQRFL